MNDQAEFIPAAEAATGKTVAEFSKTDAALAELRTQFAGAQFQVMTPAGLKEARKAVQTLREYRTALEDMRLEKVRAIVAEQKWVNAEAERITDALQALEKPIKVQIDAGEEHRLAEKAKAEKAEADRVAKNRANLEALRNMPLQLIGQGADAISETLAKLRNIPPAAMVDADFFDEATAAHAVTVATLERMHGEATAAAARAAELEAQQAELERLRKQEAERQRIANEAAAAERAEADRVAAIARAEADRLAKLERDRIAAEQAAEAQRVADAQAAEQARLDADRARMVREKAEADAAAAESARLAKIEADRLAAENAEALRKEREKAHAERAAAFKAKCDAATLLTAAQAASEYLIEIEHGHAPAALQLAAVLRRESERCPAAEFVAAVEAAGVAA